MYCLFIHSQFDITGRWVGHWAIRAVRWILPWKYVELPALMNRRFRCHFDIISLSPLALLSTNRATGVYHSAFNRIACYCHYVFFMRPDIVVPKSNQGLKWHTEFSHLNRNLISPPQNNWAPMKKYKRSLNADRSTSCWPEIHSGRCASYGYLTPTTEWVKQLRDERQGKTQKPLR